MDPKPEKVVPLRNFKTVAIGEVGGSFQLQVDGKPAYTPERRVLESAQRPLMEAIAQEWTAQGGTLNPSAMPLTRLLATQLDRVAPQRAAIISGLANYIDADVLCYRAPEPPELKARQDQVWQSVLDWLAQNFAVQFVSIDGISPLRQSDAARGAFIAALEKLDDARLTALQASASVVNSVGLSMALVHAHLDARGIHAAAHLDELFQIEKWGDDEIARKRRDDILADLEAIERYLNLNA